MKILSLTVENFKNILNATIDFKNNLSGIYGPNGTGKTAVIEALEIITLYFTPKKSKEYGDELKNKIRKSINVNSSTMGIEVIFEDIEVDAVKVGMLSSSEITEAIGEMFKKYNVKPKLEELDDL